MSTGDNLPTSSPREKSRVAPPEGRRKTLDHVLKGYGTRSPHKLLLGARNRAAKSRPIELKVFQAAIRRHALKLMSRSSNKDIFPLRASTNEVAEWDPNGPDECCGENRFIVDLKGTPKSHWNRSCGQCLVQPSPTFDQVLPKKEQF
ncbi:hypothetical protein HWV62_1192 [Athelia sp. TMB]|nr:hypothetical protein HWV62_1192 [Athelia sp. TMB]